MNQSCRTQVVTSTGKFTFHKEKLSMCEAKKFCAGKGEILAPITNEEDFAAVHKLLRAGCHEGCWLCERESYFIGLDITPCGQGGKQDRVFTNGVVWDRDVHGKLYLDNVNSWHEPCVFAGVLPDLDQPALGMWYGCYQHEKSFICLKPADPTKVVSSGSCNSSSPKALIVNENNQIFFVVGFIGFLLLSAVFLALISLIYYRKYRDVETKIVK